MTEQKKPNFLREPRDRYDSTDAAIMQANGLMFAFYELWDNSDCVDQSKPAAHSMNTLMILLRDLLEDIQTAHSKEWETVRELEGKAA